MLRDNRAAFVAKLPQWAMLGVVVLIVAVSCNTSATEPLRVMMIGDSITAGYTDNPVWDVPFEFGYRSGLYTRLNDAGYNFKFVGSSAEPYNNMFGDPTRGGTVSPPLDLRTLGQDGHHGYGGIGIAQTRRGVGGWIAADEPDVILLMIGINGISPNSDRQLDGLVSTIFNADPDVSLIVAQITPFGSYNQDLVDYNTHIRETLVPTNAANGFKISTVDLYSMFLTDPNDPTSIGDGLHSNPQKNHPSAQMYDRMAEAWFAGIEAVVVPEPSTAALVAFTVLGVLAGARRHG